jgi:beta-glucosidase
MGVKKLTVGRQDVVTHAQRRLRRSRRHFLSTAWALSSSAFVGCQKAVPQARTVTARAADEQRVETLLSRMTLEEKLGQMSQHSIGMIAENQLEDAVRRGRVGSCLNATLEVRNRLQKIAMEESRLKVPLVFGRDVIHGYRTIFPIPLGQATSFNPELVEEAARVAAREAASAGVDWTFAPMVDVSRDPRWGRVAESCGEDPWLTSVLGSAMVRGFQGRNVSDPERVLACAKHFVGYGAAEAGKDYNTADIPEQVLREVYLAPFRACVQSGVQTLMSAFNELNGVPASANEFTLRQVLREEWGFQGFVVSDWTSVLELIAHGLSADERTAARDAIHSGVDMEMVSQTFVSHGVSLVESGEIPLATVNESVRCILRVKLARGLFERPYVTPPAKSVLLAPEHLDVARRLAEESVALLKNEGELLPLDPKLRSIALVGPLADAQRDQMGTWTMDGVAEDTITLLAALRTRYPNLAIHHAPGVPRPRSSEKTGIAEAVAAAQRAQAIVVCVGEDAAISGEARSRALLDLPGAQNELVNAIAALGRPFVLLVLTGRPLTIEGAIERAAAVLWSYHPGTMGGPALVNLLFGHCSPSAKLTLSIPRTVGQIPVYYSHKSTGRPPKDDHRPEVPVGTALDPSDFTARYLDVESSPLFPFGFGLTYGKMVYSALEVLTPRVGRSQRLSVRARLENQGKRAATEVAQLYVRDLFASVTRPVKQLKGFQRVHLQPGEGRLVDFVLNAADLAFPGRDGKPTLEPGKFHVWIGGDSRADLRGEFELV